MSSSRMGACPHHSELRWPRIRASSPIASRYSLKAAFSAAVSSGGIVGLFLLFAFGLDFVEQRQRREVPLIAIRDLVRRRQEHGGGVIFGTLFDRCHRNNPPP